MGLESALARKRATPQAIDLLQQRALHRSRELPQLEGPVQSRSLSLIEPVVGLRSLSRGYLTGQEEFSCGMRIAVLESTPDPRVERTARGYDFQVSFFPSPLSSHLPSIYCFFQTRIESGDLHTVLLSLHPFALQVFHAKEKELPARFKRDPFPPLFTRQSTMQFAEDAVRAIQPL